MLTTSLLDVIGISLAALCAALATPPCIRSAHEGIQPLSRMRVWRGWEDRTHLLDGIKARGLYGPFPSRSVAGSLLAAAVNGVQAFKTAPDGTVPSVTKRRDAAHVSEPASSLSAASTPVVSRACS